MPVAGFFAAGELGPVGGRNFIHGHTASFALFARAERMRKPRERRRRLPRRSPGRMREDLAYSAPMSVFVKFHVRSA